MTFNKSNCLDENGFLDGKIIADLVQQRLSRNATKEKEKINEIIKRIDDELYVAFIDNELYELDIYPIIHKLNGLSFIPTLEHHYCKTYNWCHIEQDSCIATDIIMISINLT